jgi:hypothetical protein
MTVHPRSMLVVIALFMGVVQGAPWTENHEKAAYIESDHLHRRHLQSLTGNETKLLLADMTLPVAMGTIEAVVMASNITCSGIKIEEYDFQFDVRTQSASDDTPTLFAHVHALSFALVCDFDYQYFSAIANGTGRARLVTSNNTLETDALIVQPGMDKEDLTTSNCLSTMSVDRLEFLTVEPLAPVLETVVKVPTIGERFAGEFCKLVSKSQVFYLFFGTLASTVSKIAKADVLAAQHAIVVPANAQLVDFENSDAKWPEWGVNMVLDVLGPYLGKESTRDNVADLNVNHMVRDYFLDDNGAYVLNITNGTVFKGVDLSNQPTTFQFHTAVISGLDRFTRLSKVTTLGSQTLQANASIDSLYVQMFATLETVADVKEIEVILNASNLDASMTVMLAIDSAALGDMPLGALLDSDTITACLLSSIIDLEIADSVIDSLVIKPPSSPTPNLILDAGIRLKLDSVVGELVAQIVGRQELPKEKCETAPFTNPGNPYIDFRDFFLEPEQARAYGGSGTQPYGNLTTTTKSYLDDEYLTTNETGQLGINSQLIVPLTEEQSGVVGKYEITTPFTVFESSRKGTKLNSRIGLTLQKLTLEALDSFTTPIALMDPVPETSAVVTNALSMAQLRASGVIDFVLEAPGKSFGCSFRLPHVIRSQASHFTSGDSRSTGLLRESVLMEFRIDFASFSIVASLFASVMEQAFVNFPFRDALIAQCWLSTIPATDENTAQSLSLSNLSVSLGDMQLSLDCLDCAQSSDPVSGSFSAVSQSFDQRLSSIFSEENIGQWLKDAPKHCPHHKDYDPSWQTMNDSSTDSSKAEYSSTPSAMVTIVFLVGVGLALAGSVLYYGAGWVSCAKYKKWLGTLPLARILAIRDVQVRESEKQNNVSMLAGSMFTSSVAPQPLKGLVPLVLLASSALLVVGVLADSTRAYIYARLLGQDMLVVDFKLSILNLATELWNGGGELNAVSLHGALRPNHLAAVPLFLTALQLFLHSLLH